MNVIDLIILLILDVILIYCIILKIRKNFFLNSIFDSKLNIINIAGLEKKESRLRCDGRCEFCQFRG